MMLILYIGVKLMVRLYTVNKGGENRLFQ